MGLARQLGRLEPLRLVLDQGPAGEQGIHVISFLAACFQLEMGSLLASSFFAAA